MRILHLSTSDIRGGAARGAFFLHTALRGLNVESTMLVGRKYSDDENIEELGGALAPATERLRDILDRLPLRRYRKTDDSFWTVGWLPRNLSGAVMARQPDLVHLHWTGGGFLPIGTLRQLPCPIVWTVRDMWAFTGGCHYTAGCERFQTGCGRCPQLASTQEDDLSRRIWMRKRDDWKRLDLWLVPLSQWLADCARRSDIFRNTPVEVIPNGVDCDLFRPAPRAETRARLGLDPNKRYLLFGALGALRDRRKGFPELLEAMSRLADHTATGDVELVVFGDLAPDAMPDTGVATRFLGHIDDDDRLAALYVAADVMITPSLQEAFGKTLIEAMACGTPVVAFDSGGPGEIVLHKQTGYLAQPFDPDDLAQGVAWCLENDTHALGAAARRRVEQEYRTGVVAQRYLDHYRKILAHAA